jgi:YD repeat-containing protein
VVALASQRRSYTAYGQLATIADVFGRSTSNTYDSNGLYPTQAVVTATPSPNLTTNYTFNSLGQLILSTRVNGTQSIAQQTWRDSWGRVVGTVKNCVTAVAPPSLCNAAADAATNVMTRYAYDANGNLVDRFDQGQTSGTWVDSHIDYDLNGNVLDRIANYVSGQSETASQNVTTRFVYDNVNLLTDVTSPAATAGSSTVTHIVFDSARRPAVSIANYVVGGASDNQTNVTTTAAYDADGRLTTTWKPIGGGAVPTVTTYDVLGRQIRQVAGANTPPQDFRAVVAQTDWTLDPGGRITDVLNPPSGSPGVRYDTRYELDALGRNLKVTRAYQCGVSCSSATTRYVYDPRGATVTYSPPTQQLAGGAATRTAFDLAGQTLSTIRDWQAGAGSAPDLNVTTSLTYDGYGRPTDKTDPRGVVTHANYDALDRPTSATLDPTGLNLTTSYTYSLAGDRVQVISPRDGTNRTDQTVYDGLHRPITVYLNCVNCLSGGVQDFQTNVETDTTYDSLGKVLTVTDVLHRVTKTDYDALGRRIDQIQNCVPTTTCAGAATFDQNVKTVWTIDSSGLVLGEQSPRIGGTDNINLTTGYLYDVLGHVVVVRQDQGSTSNGHLDLWTSYTYDAAGNLLSMMDPGNQTTTYTIDQFGRTTNVTMRATTRS